jgi:hypothetical protein
MSPLIDDSSSVLAAKMILKTVAPIASDLGMAS